MEIQPGQVVQLNPAGPGVLLRPMDYLSARGLVMRTYRWAAQDRMLDILWTDGSRDACVPAGYFLASD